MRNFIVLELTDKELHNKKLCNELLVKNREKFIFNLQNGYLYILNNPANGNILISESKYIKYLSKTVLSEIINNHFEVNSDSNLDSIDFYYIDKIIDNYLKDTFNIEITNNSIKSTSNKEIEKVDFESFDVLCKQLDRDISEYLYV